MEKFKSYRIEKNDDEITLVLYLNEKDTEFSRDIIEIGKDISKLDGNIYNYIKNKFPQLPIKTVKFVLGGVIIATISFSTLTVKATSSSSVSTNKINIPILQNTYKVKKGDTVEKIAKKFNIPVADILKYNYMERGEWLDENEVIVLNTFAARLNTVTKGKDSKPLRKGNLVDWFLEAQYIIKRGNVFTVVDVDSGKQFKVKMMGGYNHSDIEPLTKNDTKIMKELFGKWQWTPRAVVVYKDGMNLAASLSGEPHDSDTIKDNNVKGHFDLYFLNSKPHNSKTSKTYIKKHYNMVLKAAKK